jgi:hypothetical protein
VGVLDDRHAAAAGADDDRPGVHEHPDRFDLDDPPGLR